MFNVTFILTLTLTLRCFTDVDMQFRYVKVYFQTCYSCKTYLTCLLFQASLRFGKPPVMGCQKPDFTGDGSRVSGFGIPYCGSGPEDQLRYARLSYEKMTAI